MKPILEHLPKKAHESFVAVEFNYRFFPTPWHYHPEYELVYIVKGTGIRFIGDSISEFQQGQLTLIGANIPHYYRSDETHYRDKELTSKSIVVHFSEDSFGPGFFHLPETKLINKMLEKSKRGLEIEGKLNRSIVGLLQLLVQKKGMDRIVIFLDILNRISQSKDKKILCKTIALIHNPTDTKRLQRALDYIFKNFHRSIRLEEVAKLSNLADASFSRYFKQHTKKSFKDFLILVRLNHVTKLLTETDIPISQVCFDSGFNNMSNFNRLFLKHFRVSPLKYRALKNRDFV